MTAAAKPQNALAKTEEPKGLTALMQHEAAKRQILPFLRGENYDRVVQEVILAASTNPEIRECTAQSIIASVARAVSWGGVIGEDVYLVPFNVNIGTREQPEWEKRCQPIKDYKFKAKLIQQTGAARQVYAVAVYANEPFTFKQGTQPTVEHAIILDEKKRGAMVGAYAVARLRDGEFQIVSKTTADIDKVRQRYSKSWKNGELPEWYALKTVIHQLAKLLPNNAKLAALIEEDERIEEGLLDSGPVTVIAAPEVQRLSNGAEALPVRGNPMMTNDGYDAVEPKRSEAESEKTSAGGEPFGVDPMEQDTDVVTQIGLTSAGEWEVPAGDLRGRKLGHLKNDELLALKDAMSRHKRYAGTIDQIDNLLEERREVGE